MEKKINFSFRFLLRALAAWIITVLPLLFIAAFIANKLSVDTSGLAYISATLSSIAAAAALTAWLGLRLDTGILRKIFGGFLLLVGLKELFGRYPRDKKDR